MDKKTKLKYDPFGIVDMFYKQNWLEYQARKGLLLANDNLLTCRFTVDEPRDRRYRILPYKHSKTTQEELDLYASCGWHLIYGYGSVMIFYTDDPDAPEPFTDVQSQHKYYRKSLITNFITMAILLADVFFIISRSLQGFTLSPSELLYSSADQPLSSVVMSLIGLPLALLYWFQYMFTYISILNKNRKKDYYGTSGFRLKYYTNATLFITLTVLLLWSIVDIPRTVDVSSSGDFTEALKYKGNEIVRFSEFDPDTWRTLYKKIEYYHDGKGDMITFDVNQDKTLMMPRMVSEELEVDRDIKNDEDTVTDLYYRVNLYKAKSSKIATEFMKYNSKNALEESDIKVSKKSIDKFRFDYKDLDYAAYIVDEKKANDTTAKRDQLLLLRKGNKYVSVSYYGPIDLKSKVGLFAEKM
ncbi:MAG: DUF2812 domain-containing protein [Mogibacterium diversum]|mgnify:FL=1|uniref:DUF2812 domain-containing protein n=1 Tax=Mogibacterium diversum TaxID=114527 RepID=UPI00181D8D70|nr:DUF2812 domain-containing protein [Mogibacterium diversum]MBB1548374.1 DUF2812 domain-containing protein [Mogibacterium sp.]MBF1341734.1 DUF2812 domain-containing protein [Mogibacterium diversum]